MRLDTIRRWGLGMVVSSAIAVAAVPAGPGVVNYIEGDARLGNRTITGQSIGSAQLQRGDVLQTANGRAEVLLTPGVFLRLDQNSSVRMLSPELLNTRVQLLRGSALVEVADLRKGNDVRVIDEGSQTKLLKKGLYRFSADTDTVAVYDGKATVMADDRSVDVKSGHEVDLKGTFTDRKFDKKATQQKDALYTWSKLRSDYLSEASAQTAQVYVANSWGYPGSGFYWNPLMRTYAWMPGDPFFYSPFGAAYYSPFAFTGPYYYGPTYVYRGRPHSWQGGPTRVGPGPVIRPRGGFHGGIVQRGINPGLVPRHR